MRTCFLFFLFYTYSRCREQGPPPIDSGLFNKFEYYYDVYINETTMALPDLDPLFEILQALYISGNLKVTHRELTTFFEKYNTFQYGIRINNTNLQTLSFLKPYWVNALDDTKNSIEITNNQNLTTLGIDFEECPYCYDNIVITNNPQLDLKDDCDAIIKQYSSYRTINGNFNDCGCAIKGEFNNYVKTMAPNCWLLFGNVSIDEHSDLTILQEKMANVTRISGGLSIKNTNFVDLSFLSAVEWIEIDAYKSEYLASIVITNNTNLTSLKMNAKRDGLYLTIRDNPKLCITPQDLDNLFYALSLDSNLDINVCYNDETPSYWCHLPENGSFTNLPDGCVNLTGNLVLDNNLDFKNTYKLYDVEMLYGSMTISNTTLRNMNMFPRLQKIRSIKDNVAPITVTSNAKLIDLFNELKGVESGMAAIVENNSNLIVSQATCSFYRTRKTASVKKNLDNCGESGIQSNPKYDRTPLNVDVFHGIPVYSNVLNPDGAINDGSIKNNPWDRNATGGADDENEVESTTKNGNSGTNALTVSILMISLIACNYL